MQIISDELDKKLQTLIDLGIEQTKKSLTATNEEPSDKVDVFEEFKHKSVTDVAEDVAGAQALLANMRLGKDKYDHDVVVDTAVLVAFEKYVAALVVKFVEFAASRS